MSLVFDPDTCELPRPVVARMAGELARRVARGNRELLSAGEAGNSRPLTCWSEVRASARRATT